MRSFDGNHTLISVLLHNLELGELRGQAFPILVALLVLGFEMSNSPVGGERVIIEPVSSRRIRIAQENEMAVAHSGVLKAPVSTLYFVERDSLTC